MSSLFYPVQPQKSVGASATNLATRIVDQLRPDSAPAPNNKTGFDAMKIEMMALNETGGWIKQGQELHNLYQPEDVDAVTS